MNRWICTPFQGLSRRDAALAGGKGANLGEMVQAGLPIPPGFVICAPAYRATVERTGIQRQVAELLDSLDRRDLHRLREAEPQIRSLFAGLPLADEMRWVILEHYRALGPSVPVAVRSSATAEDLATASFAGQQETFLNVIGEEALLQAVCRCWSSLFTSQAIFYRDQHGFDHSQVSMAVVVQRMVKSAKSGVTFTVDPVLLNRFYMIVEAVWGLGEGIVSGEITPDHYRVDRETGEIVEAFVPEKRIMFCEDGRRGVVRRDVPPPLATERVLSDDELRRLVDLGNRLERHFGCPQDIEWGIDEGTVYLLQSRPITSL